MQLPPVVSNSKSSDYKKWNISNQADGLSSFALGSDVKSYRITTTFRLTKESALFTGIFYNNSLVSVQPKPITFPLLDKNLFPKEGGVRYLVCSGNTDGIGSKKALKQIEVIINLLEDNYPKTSVAIISPFKDTVRKLQSMLYDDKRKLDLTIETIDRVQGITVDYSILFFPYRNVGFAVEEHRFNVAYSRSRSTTLIINDYELLDINTITGKVRNFISKAKRI